MNRPRTVGIPGKVWISSLLGLSACTGVLSDPVPDPQHNRAPARYVFATRAVYGAGELHGIAGADQICTISAVTAGVAGAASRDGGTDVPYRAWLSAVDDPVRARFEHSDVPYKLLDGTVVASDWDDLVDGTLAHPIDRDEHDVAIAASDVAGTWTFTRTNGRQAPWHGGDPTSDPRLDCEAWTTAAAFGWVGDLHDRSAGWTAPGSGDDCSIPHHLYCFEQ